MVSENTLQNAWTEVEYSLDICRASICEQTELYKGREWSKKKKLPAFVFVAVQTTQFYVVLCFVDRASLYNLVNTTNLVHKIS